MQILVHHAGQQLGPFTLEEARAAVASGAVHDTDLAWREGLPTWVPLSTLLYPAASSVPSAAVSNYTTAAPTSGMAITSLVLGICSPFFCVLTGIPAIIFGHIARAEIRRSAGRIAGDGMALAGLILGYLSTALVVGGVLFMVIFAGVVGMSTPKPLQALNQSAVPEYPSNAAKQVYRACKLYAADHGGKFPETLEELVPTYLAERKMLACPIAPEEEVGYYYFGGSDSDPGQEDLMMSKGVDEKGRRVVTRKDGTIYAAKIAAPKPE